MKNVKNYALHFSRVYFGMQFKSLDRVSFKNLNVISKRLWFQCEECVLLSPAKSSLWLLRTDALVEQLCQAKVFNEVTEGLG